MATVPEVPSPDPCHAWRGVPMRWSTPGAHPTTPMSLTSLKTDATPVEINGRRLKCLQCSAESFHRRRSHVETAMVTTMNPEWADRQVQCLVCDDCGFIHWFWVG